MSFAHGQNFAFFHNGDAIAKDFCLFHIMCRKQNRVAFGGALFLNSSIIAVESSRHDVRIFKIPSSEMAEKLGNPRTANTVMMGAFLKMTGLVPPDIYLSSMETVMGSKKKSVIEINRKAFAAGYEFLKMAE